MRKACWNCKYHKRKFIEERDIAYNWCELYDENSNDIVVTNNISEPRLYCDDWKNGIDELTDEEKTEVLAILKKHIVYDKGNDFGYADFNLSYPDFEDKEELEKVKEWLSKDV